MGNSFVRLFFLTTFCLFFIGTAGDAADGLAMLKNDHSARAAGMGAAFVSISGDPNAAVYNPAGAVGVDKFTASFGHTFFWERVRMESGYIVANLASRTYVHGGIRFAAVDELEGRLHPTTDPYDLFDAHEVSFKGGLAYQISDRIATGFAAGWFVEKIEAWRGSSFNVDVGLLVSPSDDVNLGASVTNIGSAFMLEKRGLEGSRDIPLPTTYRLGASYRYAPYLGVLDVVILDDKFHLHSGAEVQLHEQLSLRTGYMFNYDTKNFTAGASFTKRNMTIDYAFVPFSAGLGPVHMFNFTLSL
jgi:hypothetical protein